MKLKCASELLTKANEIRKRLVDVAVKNRAGHIAPSLSCVDILTVLYYSVMNLDADPKWEDRDRLVFSKAHGAYGLYAILADIGYLDEKDWTQFYKDSFLKGCIERSIDHGIEAGCGSLGHGLPMATGIAFGARLQKKDYRTYCIVGDGEMQEGSNWEAVQFAVKHGLNNLVIIVDCNGLQAMDSLENILSPQNSYDDLSCKFKAFGAEIIPCHGHRIKYLKKAFEKISANRNKGPAVILAKTVKGYGIKAIENVPKFHFRIPTQAELSEGLRYE